MALTYTLAGLQTQLDLVDASVAAEDWAVAIKNIARAELVLAGLPQSAASDTQSVTMRASLESAKNLVMASRSVVVDNRRLMRAGVRHLSGLPDRRCR